MPRSDDHLTIGEVARSARLTVRALRHYEAVGVLRPARTDDRSGYRLYDRAQVRDAIAIAVLRDLDVPLPDIARALRGPDDLAEVLAAEAARIEQRIARSTRALAAVQRILVDGELLAADVRVVDVEDRPVLALTGEVGEETLIDDTTALVDELLVLAGRHGIDGPVSVEFPVDLAGRFRAAATIEAPAPVATGTAAGGAMATVEHVGPYETLPLAYAALFAWAGAERVTLAGTVRETYLDDGSGVDGGREPRTLVQGRCIPG